MAFDWKKLKEKANKLKDKVIVIADKISTKTENLTDNVWERYKDKVTEDIFALETENELIKLLDENKKVTILFIDKKSKNTEDILYKVPYYHTKAWAKMIKFKMIEKSKAKDILNKYNIKRFPTLINFIETNEIERFDDIDSVKKNLSVMDF